MWVIASFYYDIPPKAITIGIAVASVAVLALGLSRRVLVGFIGGMLSCGIIAYFVIDTGHGDMRELTMWFCVPFWAVVGGLAGGIFAGIAKWWRAMRQRGRHEPQ